TKSLLQENKVLTEENKITRYLVRAKLYCMDQEQQWKEREVEISKKNPCG
ncbi:8439_t:CDS:2, partial [Acaulospora morrowiae]